MRSGLEPATRGKGSHCGYAEALRGTGWMISVGRSQSAMLQRAVV